MGGLKKLLRLAPDRVDRVTAVLDLKYLVTQLCDLLHDQSLRSY